MDDYYPEYNEPNIDPIDDTTALTRLFDIGQICVYFSAILTVYYGSYRSLNLEKDIKIAERSGREHALTEAVSTIDSRQTLLIPIAASLTLLFVFYFLFSAQIIMTISICFSANFAMIYTFNPISEKVVQYLSFSKSYKLPILNEIIPMSALIGFIPSILILIGYFLTHYWVLNNIIGFSLCISALTFLRFPNYKVSTTLLVLLFFYDIFWVFYSEKVFGKNVMVSVATSIRLPVLLMFPSYASRRGFSMLGLGDIVLPGLVIALSKKVDWFKNNQISFPFGYFWTAWIGYSFGMMITVIIVSVFRVAQPALLYLVPSTLLPIFIRARMNGEFYQIWSGIKVDGRPLFNDNNNNNNNNNNIENDENDISSENDPLIA